MPSAPPPARGSRLLGNTLDLQRDQLGTYARAMAEHGDVARFRVGPPGVGFTFDAVFSPEGARQVLAADAGNYVKDAPVIGEFRHFLGNGLLVSEGERWRRDRRIAQPLFTRRAVTGHLETIAMAAAELQSWCVADSTAGRAIDLTELSMRYALNALGHTVFGDDIVQAAPTLRSVLPALGDHLKRRSLTPVRTPHSWPTPANRRAEGIRKVVWDLADELIAKRRAGGSDGRDLLSRLLDARDPDTGDALSDDDVRDEAIIFLIAGHETTGSALAFTLQLLGRHQEVQERARAEVLDVVGRQPGGPYEIEQLPYVATVVDEAMRLYPPAHTVVRRAAEETELLGYPVEKGRIVAVNIWGIHHRQSVWSDPFEFSPERFEESRRAAQPSRRSSGYTHLPFAGGPRACIGEHLAMAELVAAVAGLLARYRLRSQLESPDLEVDLALRPKGALPCLFEPL
ncbi:MAG TPA: cytochrome P450 [Acidimicrobiales bacterium]|nr:cytochrome P450 [Acidimicrobiales bacterium]